VRISAVQLDAQHLDSWLETGTIDFAMGSFPYLTKGVRRQPLWIERYVSVVRKDHPRLRTSLCRVPIFLAASIIAKRSDAVATLPLSNRAGRLGRVRA
jgi:DNA-binding transcriptional LysR family regulator